MSNKPRGAQAVMAVRMNPVDDLDFFPTPPWATRALMEHVIPGVDRNASVWEPACGAGHMSDVLIEYCPRLLPSDVHKYGDHHIVGSFVGRGPDVLQPQHPHDWIITNPPFNLAVDFVERALGEARDGVAMLVRSSWMEGADRYKRLFLPRPPTIVAPFVERVPMVKGRWDPAASTATAYAWFVWLQQPALAPTTLEWIPPGCRTRLTRPDDVARFAARALSEFDK